MTDIVTRLRRMTSSNWLGGMKDRMLIATDAIDEIEKLREQFNTDDYRGPW